jgi:hypothetical protein
MTIESGPENRRLDRLEAKLDLALHLLARSAGAGKRHHLATTVRLGGEEPWPGTTTRPRRRGRRPWSWNCGLPKLCP